MISSDIVAAHPNDLVQVLDLRVVGVAVRKAVQHEVVRDEIELSVCSVRDFQRRVDEVGRVAHEERAAQIMRRDDRLDTRLELVFLVVRLPCAAGRAVALAAGRSVAGAVLAVRRAVGVPHVHKDVNARTVGVIHRAFAVGQTSGLGVVIVGVVQVCSARWNSRVVFWDTSQQERASCWDSQPNEVS